MNAQRARERHWITDLELHALMTRTSSRLQAAGFRHAALRPSHLLLSMRHDKSLVRDPDDLPVTSLCNFSLVQRPAD